MARCAIFASGTGSNFEQLEKSLRKHPVHSVACLVCDKPSAPVVTKALSAGIPVVPITYTRSSHGILDRSTAEKKTASILHSLGVDCIALAGFMKILSPALLTEFPNRILNIHPSLLPHHPGAHGMRDSIESADTVLGITIHIVDSGVDTGPILAQRSFTRTSSESPASEELRIHQLEHEAYPQVLLEFMDTIRH